MWRDRVYSGSLRPTNTEVITGEYLNDLLGELNGSIRINHSTRISDAHDINCICQGVYLGDRFAARDKRFLVKNGITHVLNAAEGRDEHQVNTSQTFYNDAGIKYLGIPGHDRPSWNISAYFEAAARFINEAVERGDKVLVHCVVGISRSATLVLAYFMVHKRMNAAQALAYVFRRRQIYPNHGFLSQLAHFNSSLRRTLPLKPVY